MFCSTRGEEEEEEEEKETKICILLVAHKTT